MSERGAVIAVMAVILTFAVWLAFVAHAIPSQEESLSSAKNRMSIVWPEATRKTCYMVDGGTAECILYVDDMKLHYRCFNYGRKCMLMNPAELSR
jgi:hypothetical protein